jgi:hypothetical protein
MQFAFTLKNLVLQILITIPLIKNVKLRLRVHVSCTGTI